MTPQELRASLTTLRWSQRDLAEEAGVDEKQVRRWMRGARVPAPVTTYLRMLAQYHQRMAPAWVRRGG